MSDTQWQNRLAGESSPYLRQHAGNPVDWYPWGEDAFARARSEDKPVFLSIGYSTCHWCHVMAHESFENEAIAAQLNRSFICVKVDREERPDIDRVYMAFVQATTGSGGWPMSVWLTPDLLPFYGGTYFPPEDRWGRPGFASMLGALERVWTHDRENVLKQGAHSIQVLRQFGSHHGGDGEADLNFAAIDRVLSWCDENFDEQQGGFGAAPKFPRPVLLEFLWRAHAAAQHRGEATLAEAARRFAETTLRRMTAGGMHDHLGGGFHRYSVDAFWHVPHFEKMLYDQAQLVPTLLEAGLVTGDATFARAAEDTLEYVRRDLTAPEGGFYSAEDADSLRLSGGRESAEGAFYVWSIAEIEQLLGKERAMAFNARYGVEARGNAPPGSDPHGEFAGFNILIERAPAASTAVAPMLADCRKTLFAARAKRPRPHRDEKILAAWNGLMISAFARAATSREQPLYVAIATQAAAFIDEQLWDASTGIVRRSFCDGRVGPEGFAEDYACLIQGSLDLYEATFSIRWLQWAVNLQAAQDRLFGDASCGGYFSSAGRDKTVLVRMKEDHDGAEPAPSSVAVRNLIRLGRMLDNAKYLERAEKTLRGFSATWKRSPQALPAMMSGLIDWLRPPWQVVLAGTPGAKDFSRLLREVGRRYLPGVVLLAADQADGQKWLSERVAALRDLRPVDGKAAAYVCENFTCQLPVTDPKELARLLDGGSGSR